MENKDISDRRLKEKNYANHYYHNVLKKNPKFVEKRRERDRIKYWKDLDKAKLKYKKYFQKPGVKEKRREYQKNWVIKNLEYVKECRKKDWLKNKQTIYSRGKNPNSHKKKGKKNLFAKKIRRLCPRCKERPAKSSHHIIPRQFKGNDSKENLILLCYECHNKIEIFTYDLFIEGKKIITKVLHFLQR